MLFSLLSVLAVTVAGFPQDQSTLDPTLIAEIFGTPATRTEGSSTRFEDITVKPTQSGTIYTNKDGDNCQCVPYYLCDNKNTSAYVNDPKYNGWGELDIRFGENCQESVERCCKNPLPEPAPEPVTPDPNTMRGCGYRNPKGLDFTIKGGYGNEAQFGEFPWVIALLDAKDLTYIGVGVLIHPQVVMTAAHVVYKFTPGSIIVRAGEWDTQTNKERLKAQERLVQDIVVREDFHPKSLRNDLALLRLQEPLELMEHINVICLPRQNEDFDHYKNCVANGWGKENFGLKGRYAVILKKIEVDMVPFPLCASLLKQTRLGHWFKLHDSFVCAGGEEGKDTCTGDGGAPLACPVGGDRYKLCGLVAWGIGCGLRDVPAVYARVPMFRGWVDRVVASWGYDTAVYDM